MEFRSEHCGRCGRLAEGFARDKAIGQSSAYCNSCIKELGEELHGRDVCSLCRCAIWDGAPRFVMPSRIYSSYFLDRLPVGNRLMCTHCYWNVERSGLMNDKLAKLGSIRARLAKNRVRATHARIRKVGKPLTSSSLR